MSGTTAFHSQAAQRVPLAANYDQAIGSINSQLKTQREMRSKAAIGLENDQVHGRKFMSFYGAQKASDSANTQITQLKQWKKAWGIWNTTAVPVGMSPKQYKKSLL